MPLAASEPPAETRDSAAQSGTIFNDPLEAESSDDDPIPALRKRNRNPHAYCYSDPESESDKPVKRKRGLTYRKSAQGSSDTDEPPNKNPRRTRKGHDVKHGVPIGVWSLSDEPVDERKHVLYGFLDPNFALHGRRYPERKDGSKYTGNFPSGTGTWAAKADEWLLDPHLKDLTRKELTEYVRIRMATWKIDENPQERDALDKSAVAEAKAAAAASKSTIKSENKGSSARKAKNSTPRTLNAKSSDSGSSQALEIPPRERSKYVIKGKDVLIGYWKDSSEPKVINKHAMYGVIQAHGVFRVKVVPETRYGKYLEGGNYPKHSGGCWVSYDTCVLEKYLNDLIRPEIEEYCRICVADPQYNNRTQGPAIDRAVQEAKRRVVEKAAAKGLDIIEYNRKRCDELDKGAVSREVEKQKRNGEVVTPVKAEVKYTAKRSDKATSDARAQMVRLARKEAREARERETMNSKGDADMAEAMRRSASEQKALEAQKKSNRNSDVSPATPGAVNNSNWVETCWRRHTKDLTSAYNHLRPDSSTPMSDGDSVNGAETENVKFYLLDRDIQRVKMERWCKLKPTSQYHTMDKGGQKRHVEKHIDQLIARQTGAAISRRPKKRSRTGDYPSASPAQPGMVSAPSPLAGMTRATSTPATAATTSQEPVPTLADTGFATGKALRSRSGPIILAPAPPAAPEIAAVESSSRIDSPAARQEVPTHRALRSVPNEPITPIQSESEATTQPKFVENTADVPMVDAPVETTAAPAQPVTSNSTPPAESSATLVATVETETVQNKPTAATTQPTPTGNATDEQRAASEPYEPPGATPDGAENDVPMADAPIEAIQASTLPLSSTSSSLTPDAIETRIPTEHPQGFMSAPSRPHPPSAVPPTRSPAPPAAPQIFHGHDGVKYSVDPSSEFGDLLVSVDRELVEIEDVEYTRQLVLVAKKAPRPPRAKGEELKWGDEVFKMAGEGVFGGYAVGVERRVTRLAGEDYVKFVVLVPF